MTGRRRGRRARFGAALFGVGTGGDRASGSAAFSAFPPPISRLPRPTGSRMEFTRCGPRRRPAHPGVASFGVRPSVDNGPPLLEVHLLDFDGDLYGQEMAVEFVERIREERRFESLDLLVAEMQSRHRARARDPGSEGQPSIWRFAANPLIASLPPGKLNAVLTSMTDAPVQGFDYSRTLYLPKTDFPMRAGLPQKEPEILARWQREDLYGALRRSGKGRAKFVLHDGPPYANGNVHIGTALNKILKDTVVRSQQMAGKDSNYVPGWDCHGLPIEWKVEEESYPSKGKAKPDFSDAEAIIAFRRECRAYAERWIACRGRNSSGSASSATGTTPTRP